MSGVLCQCSTTGVRLGTGDLGIPTFLTTSIISLRQSENSLLIKLFKCDFDPQRKELLTELHFTPTSGSRINSYEKNHNEREKKTK